MVHKGVSLNDEVERKTFKIEIDQGILVIGRKEVKRQKILK